MQGCPSSVRFLRPKHGTSVATDDASLCKRERVARLAPAGYGAGRGLPPSTIKAYGHMLYNGARSVGQQGQLEMTTKGEAPKAAALWLWLQLCFFTSVFLLSGRVLGLLQDGLAVGASFF